MSYTHSTRRPYVRHDPKRASPNPDDPFDICVKVAQAANLEFLPADVMDHLKEAFYSQQPDYDEMRAAGNEQLFSSVL